MMGMVAVAMMLGGCAETDNDVMETAPAVKDGQTVKIKVVDNGYGDVTRAAESNEEEAQGENTIMQTNFIAGDKIGVFSISAGGAVHYNNLELRYNGTEWVNPDGETFYYFTGMRYYAYYPYNPDFDSENGVDWSAEGVDAFFAPYVNAWQPQVDQSTSKKYMASDLMVGAGAVSGETFTFSMGHTMGLIFISVAEELNGTVYLFPKLTEADAITKFDASTTKIFSFEQGVYKASQKQGYYRYIVKPGGAPTFISGMNPDGRLFSFTCDNVSGGHYKKYVVDGGFDPTKSTIEDFTVQVGDIMFSDMHIEHQPEEVARISNYTSSVGIISYLADSDDEFTEGYVHGLVLDRNHNNSQSFWSGSSSYADYKDIEGCPNIASNEFDIDKSGLTNSTAIGSVSSGGAFTSSAFNTKASKRFVASTGQWKRMLTALREVSAGMTDKMQTDMKTLWTSVSNGNDYNWGSTSYKFFVSTEVKDNTSSTYRVYLNTYATGWTISYWNKYNGGSGTSTYKLFCSAF